MTFQQFISHIKVTHSPIHVFPDFFITVATHNSLSKQLIAFQHRLFTYWLKTKVAGYIEFVQLLKRLLAELGFELTIPGLT